jgi:hypothetical protein
MKEPSALMLSAASKALDVKGLTNKLLGPAFEQVGAMLADEVRIRMHLPLNIRLLRRVNRILEKENIKPRSVNLKVLLPLLDAAALEDDETMAERWASLLPSAANPNNKSALEASFIEILKQLSPAHAYLLDVFYKQIERRKLPAEQWNENGVGLSDLKDFLKEEVPQSEMAIQNLLRLRLVALPTVKLGVANGQDVRVQVTSSNIMCATSLGQAFVSACKRGQTPRNKSYSVPGNSISNLYGTKGRSLRLWSREEETSWAKQYGKPANNEPL